MIEAHDLKTMPLGYALESDEVENEITAFTLSLVPAEVDQAAIHDGKEPFFFGGNFPAAAAFVVGSEEYPKRIEASPQPGAVDVVLRFYLPSVTVDGDSSPRETAHRDGRRLRSGWRKNLHYPPEAENTTMQGRIHNLEVMRHESGDMNRLGFVLAVDEDTGTTLWVEHLDLRFHL